MHDQTLQRSRDACFPCREHAAVARRLHDGKILGASALRSEALRAQQSCEQKERVPLARPLGASAVTLLRGQRGRGPAKSVEGQLQPLAIYLDAPDDLKFCCFFCL